MSMVDRIVDSYARRHPLTKAQAKTVRAEIAKFAAELLEKYRASGKIEGQEKY